MSEDHHTAPTPTDEPTVAILADPRASVFLLKDTFRTLFATYGIRRAYVDLTTLTGLTAAGELIQAGIAYEHLDFGQPMPEAPTLADPVAKASRAFRPNRPRTPEDLPYLQRMSAGTHSIDLDGIHEIDANIVLVPTMTADGVIDFSADTVLGRALDRIEGSERDYLVVMPPERGLRPVRYEDDPNTPVDAFERVIVLVRPDAALSAG